MKFSLSIWHLLHNVKSTVKIWSNLVAFLENKNLNKNIVIRCSLSSFRFILFSRSKLKSEISFGLVIHSITCIGNGSSYFHFYQGQKTFTCNGYRSKYDWLHAWANLYITNHASTWKVSKDNFFLRTKIILQLLCTRTNFLLHDIWKQSKPETK